MPFAPSSLQGLHHYYGFIRHPLMPLYFDLAGSPLVSFQFDIIRGFPQFHNQALIQFLLPKCRVSVQAVYLPGDPCTLPGTG